MENTVFKEFIPTKLFFGCGEIKKLATEPMLGRKALIVISSGKSMKRYGYLDQVVSLLRQNNVATVVFDKILPNPIKEHVMEGAKLCREEDCDFVVGLGGGSSIDSAKAIAVMACNEGDYWDYVFGGSGKGKPIEGGALPIIAIPTTAGTGTEADPWTVITNKEEKIGFGNDYTFPSFSIIDPELMVSVPPKLTAYQGFDAFFHSAEGYLATIATPLSQIYSLKSIELLYKYLPKAVADGSDIEARSNVALASMIAGMVESTSSCTSEHSLEHAMSAYYHKLPHGAGLISLSLAYFEAFKEISGKRMAKMAEAMTGRKTSDPEDFLRALKEMQKACHVDGIKLSEYGIRESDLPQFAENAKETMGGLFYFDPRTLSEDEIIGIYEKSFR